MRGWRQRRCSHRPRHVAQVLGDTDEFGAAGRQAWCEPAWWQAEYDRGNRGEPPRGAGTRPFVALHRRQPSGKTDRASLRLCRDLNPAHHAEVMGKSGTSISTR
jgi:hypothetical protein